MHAKQQIRDHIWETLQRRGVARFPGAVGRIPNFDGAAEAAELVRRLQVWQRARVLKCNPDSPQLPLRRAALREGKIIYMAVPRLRQERCFIEFDPERLLAVAHLPPRAIADRMRRSWLACRRRLLYLRGGGQRLHGHAIPAPLERSVVGGRRSQPTLGAQRNRGHPRFSCCAAC